MLKIVILKLALNFPAETFCKKYYNYNATKNTVVEQSTGEHKS